MTPAALSDFRRHAAEQFPREACGLLVDDQYFPCENQATTPTEHFIIGARDYLEASKRGQIQAVCHTHPNYSAEPSEADRASCETTKLPWLILSWPTDVLVQIEPCGFMAPLVGRPFVHGVHDCFSIVRDYYKLELGIELKNYGRTDEWWERGEDLYRRNMVDAGFVKIDFASVDDLRKHDVIVMQIRSKEPNHAAVLVEPSKNVIIHHLHGQLSRRDVYGGFWFKHTAFVGRHRSLV
jgi:proteasome lid subunit RPN8/RPN11